MWIQAELDLVDGRIIICNFIRPNLIKLHAIWRHSNIMLHRNLSCSLVYDTEDQVLPNCRLWNSVNNSDGDIFSEGIVLVSCSNQGVWKLVYYKIRKITFH